MGKTFYALNKSRHSRPIVKLYKKQYNTLKVLRVCISVIYIRSLYIKNIAIMTIQIFNYPLETI